MTGAILLAAGSSSRMGQSKQMLDVGGEKLLVRTVKTLLETNVDTTVVVLGANEAEHREALRGLQVGIVTHHDWRKGMGSSIKTGLTFLRSRYPALSAALICVCDQPMLTSAVLSEILRKHQESTKGIVAAAYDGLPGVPVIFGQSFFETLERLHDHQGAKQIILDHPHDVAMVPFPGGEIDLDTMEDYTSFQKRLP